MLDLNLKGLERLSRKDKMVKKYMDCIDRINKDFTFREYMSKEEDERKIRNTELHMARNEGYSEGAHQNAIETAKNFLKMGVNTIEQIATATGLSLKEINKLKEEL